MLLWIPNTYTSKVWKHFKLEKFAGIAQFEITGLNQLKDGLESLKWASDKIACQGLTIFKTIFKPIFKTTIQTLEALNTHIAKEILHSFTNRIKVMWT